MNARLLALVFAPFAFETSAFAFVGLLNPMASDLGISVVEIFSMADTVCRLRHVIATGFVGLSLSLSPFWSSAQRLT